MLASTALHDVIDGPPREGRVLGTSRQAVWAALGEHVMVVCRPGAVRLPNAVVVDDLVDTDRFGVGGGTVALGGRRITVARWWDPKPVLSASSRETVRSAVHSLAPRITPAHDRGLGDALADRDDARVIDAARELIGRGPGLTPSGDDLVAAALATFLHLSIAIADPTGPCVLAGVAAPLHHLARKRTTALSAALIGHALEGEVALPVARLLRRIVTQGDIDTALDDLLTVGHSSGPALAHGVLIGAEAACGGPQ